MRALIAAGHRLFVLSAKPLDWQAPANGSSSSTPPPQQLQHVEVGVHSQGAARTHTPAAGG